MDNVVKGTVEFRNVVKRYGPVVALKELSLKIDAGKLVTLLGPSGCGKTTTLRLIAGLEGASEGTILIGGKDVTHLSATYRKVSMVFQSYALFPHMTVVENVAYGLTVKGMPRKQANEKAECGLSMVGLEGFGRRLPSELSGGQQQRVAVARAIVLEPEVLLLDEPLSNLDAKLRRHVREEIRQIQQDLGLTAVYVTHDQEEAMAVSDRIVVMNNAEIAQSGTPWDLYEKPTSAFIADFIGDANLVPCEVVRQEAGASIVRLGDRQISVSHCNGLGDEVKIAVKPHQISICRKNSENGFAAEVTSAAYLGNMIQYTVEGSIGSLFITSSVTETPISVGEAVFVSFEPRDVRLVS
ncbi:ABC transporter ATP-binding protein [Roseibium sp. M-1]